MNDYEGIEKGEVCNRDGCTGIIDEHEKEGGCSCHINPPCWYCVHDATFCPVCGYEGAEEQRQSIMSAPTFKPIEFPKAPEPFDDGKLYKVCRYFDDMFEATVGKDLTRPDAIKLLDKMNSQDRYYVSYQMNEQ